MTEQGLFRVTASDFKVRTLEHHMSQANYAYWIKEDVSAKSAKKAVEHPEPHVVANYLKRLLRESRFPLLPQQSYEALKVDDADLKSTIQAMPAINRNILQMIIKFCKHLALREPLNRMTPYNLAVTLGPNIFRSEVEEIDVTSHANFYQAFVNMIEKYTEIFDDEFDENELGPVEAQAPTERVDYSQKPGSDQKNLLQVDQDESIEEEEKNLEDSTKQISRAYGAAENDDDRNLQQLVGLENDQE